MGNVKISTDSGAWVVNMKKKKMLKRRMEMKDKNQFLNSVVAEPSSSSSSSFSSSFSLSSSPSSPSSSPSSSSKEESKLNFEKQKKIHKLKAHIKNFDQILAEVKKNEQDKEKLKQYIHDHRKRVTKLKAMILKIEQE